MRSRARRNERRSRAAWDVAKTLGRVEPFARRGARRVIDRTRERIASRARKSSSDFYFTRVVRSLE